MKKVLMVATVPSVIGQFNMNNVQLLKEMGYDVHVACNFFDRSVWPEDRIKEFAELLKNLKVVYHQIDFCRSPKSVNQILKSIYQMNNLIVKEKYSFVHCHTPMAGVISRLICYKKKVKVIYTAHGFHFYDGASLKNWILYYPVEKVLSYFTDILITINREDYQRAKKRFYAKKTLYIPGVGIDIEKFSNRLVNTEKIREELGISSNEVVLFSAGELNENKNHKTVIYAIKKLQNKKIHYIVAGQGILNNELKDLTRKLNLQGQVHLIGYQKDIVQWYQVADVYILPSIREGLNVSLMEAMASGLPVIGSKIRGNVDLIVPGKGGFLCIPDNRNEFAEAIKKICEDVNICRRMAEFNKKRIGKFNCLYVKERMRRIYGSI